MQEQRHGIRRGALRALTLCATLGLVAPAQAATRGYTITSFDAVRVDAPVTVVITTGGGVSARAEGDQAALDRLRVDVSGRLLTISMERGQAGAKAPGGATLRMSTGEIGRIILSGGGSVSVDRMKGQRGQIAIGGNGDLTVGAVQLDQLFLNLAGGGKAVLNGQAGVAEIHVSGPGAVLAEGLRTRQAIVGNEGAGSIALTADVAAKVIAAGSGDVMVAGKAACMVDNRGTGRVSCGGEDY